MKGKIKGPDKRTHQDPSLSCNILTFSQGTHTEACGTEDTNSGTHAGWSCWRKGYWESRWGHLFGIQRDETHITLRPCLASPITTWRQLGRGTNSPTWLQEDEARNLGEREAMACCVCMQLARITETHSCKQRGFLPAQIWDSEAQDLGISRKHHASLKGTKGQIQASHNFC